MENINGDDRRPLSLHFIPRSAKHKYKNMKTKYKYRYIYKHKYKNTKTIKKYKYFSFTPDWKVSKIRGMGERGDSRYHRNCIQMSAFPPPQAFIVFNWMRSKNWWNVRRQYSSRPQLGVFDSICWWKSLRKFLRMSYIWLPPSPWIYNFTLFRWEDIWYTFRNTVGHIWEILHDEKCSGLLDFLVLLEFIISPFSVGIFDSQSSRFFFSQLSVSNVSKSTRIARHPTQLCICSNNYQTQIQIHKYTCTNTNIHIQIYKYKYTKKYKYTSTNNVFESTRMARHRNQLCICKTTFCTCNVQTQIWSIQTLASRTNGNDFLNYRDRVYYILVWPLIAC